MTAPHNSLATAVAKALAERSLYEFVRLLWPAVEPATEMVPGAVVEAICAHLEAVAAGEVRRLILNVPPGCMKSLCTAVFFPAWVWGPLNRPAYRFLSASYSASLTERDNERCMRVVMSPLYQQLWGSRVRIEKTGVTKIGTNHTGWKLATSVGGVGTGERADCVLLDDPNNVKDVESKVIRDSTNLWLTEVIPTRLSDPASSAIVNIQQRTHEDDATGTLLRAWPEYTHLMLPMRYDPERHCETEIGFSDWRREDGDLLWPERFPARVLSELERVLGPYAVAGQLQQAPVPRGGGVIKQEWWQEWAPRETPPLEFVLASLDTAVKEREESDYTAFVALGVWRDPDTDGPRTLLLHAWHERAPLRDIAQHVVQSCRKLKVDRLVIEDKAHGWVAQQEITRMTGGWKFGVSMFDPRRYGDKMARLLSVQHLFAEGLVYAPVAAAEDGSVNWREWAEEVIDEVCNFPRARHDDYTDAMSMGLRHLRDIGFALRAEEYSEREGWDNRLPERVAPLYPV